MSDPHGTPLVKPDRAEAQEYVEHLLTTERFRKAPVLRQLLQYLVIKEAEGRTDEIKESIIAIDVFSRSQEFDSRLDNIVRVQAHRLRKLLEAYYETGSQRRLPDHDSEGELRAAGAPAGRTRPGARRHRAFGDRGPG